MSKSKLKTVESILIWIASACMMVLGVLVLCGVQLSTSEFEGVVLVFLGCLFLSTIRKRR